MNKAKGMYAISNATHVAFFEHTPDGLNKAKAFRRYHSAFARRRIREVLQCEAVDTNRAYKIGERIEREV